MKPERKNFVQFLSPGTFFSETSSKPIDSWDIAAAVEMANAIKERHGARPYGFQFYTMICAGEVPDGEGGTLKVEPKKVRRSGTHWLGGTLKFFHEIPEDDEHSIMIGNMRCNHMPICIENTNSYRFTGEFKEGDCIVGPSGEITQRGDAPGLVEYRTQKNAEFDAYYEDLRKQWAKA